jgi:hypothetical protein
MKRYRPSIIATVNAALVCYFHPLPALDWNDVLVLPPNSEEISGNQILHFKSKNRLFSDSQEGKEFVDRYLLEAVALESDAEVLRYGSDRVRVQGFFLDLGLCTGKSANFLAALNPHQKIYSFDSFEGLPEDWVRADRTIPKGTFAFKDPDFLPPVLHNVTIVKGWFKDSLPVFAREILKDQKIALVHVDSDLYSSAKTALTVLSPYMQEGTILIFDELYNFPGYENHEFKALQEFLKETGFHAEYLAYNKFHQQVALRLVKELPQKQSVDILYKNWRGEVAVRRILPETIFFGSSSWHPTPQWLLHAYDTERQAYRDFAIQDIASWTPIKD